MVRTVPGEVRGNEAPKIEVSKVGVCLEMPPRQKLVDRDWLDGSRGAAIQDRPRLESANDRNPDKEECYFDECGDDCGLQETEFFPRQGSSPLSF